MHAGPAVAQRLRSRIDRAAECVAISSDGCRLVGRFPSARAIGVSMSVETTVCGESLWESGWPARLGSLRTRSVGCGVSLTMLGTGSRPDFVSDNRESETGITGAGACMRTRARRRGRERAVNCFRHPPQRGSRHRRGEDFFVRDSGEDSTPLLSDEPHSKTQIPCGDVSVRARIDGLGARGGGITSEFTLARPFSAPPIHASPSRIRVALAIHSAGRVVRPSSR